MIKEIQERYACIILSESSFKKHVAPIEKLRADAAGIQGKVEISRKYFERVSETFHRILIDLPLDEFESIELDGLIQRADKLHPDLQVADRKKKIESMCWNTNPSRGIQTHHEDTDPSRRNWPVNGESHFEAIRRAEICGHIAQSLISLSCTTSGRA